MFNLIKTENKARRGELVTVHGTVQTPAFMNVATCGAIKGAVSALDLKHIKCQVQPDSLAFLGRHSYLHHMIL